MGADGFASGLDPSRELIEPIQPVALWSETGAYSAYDPSKDIGFWMHLGRFSYEPRLWHEALIVYLPDGQRLAFKNYGAGDTSRGPAGALMSFTCVEPFRRWHFHYDGPARRVNNEVLFAGGLPQGREERLQVELTIDSVKPIWDLASRHSGDDVPRTGASSHDEQLSEVSGRIVSDDGETPFHGYGFRDHGRGPRDMSAMAGDTLLAAWFPEADRGFLAMHVRFVDGSDLRAGRLFIGDRQEPLEAELPRIEDPRRAPDSFEVLLPTSAGQQRLQVEIKQFAPITMQSPNHLSLGMVDEPGALVLLESQAQFTWDDRVGYGYIERSTRRPEGSDGSRA